LLTSSKMAAMTSHATEELLKLFWVCIEADIY
jgi:hypothetical protein